MKILIGILAHNEEEIISQTLKSLFSQDIFLNKGYEIKIIVLANGCSDNTVDIAKTSIEKFNYKLGVKYEVIDKKTPGKINAWNDIIHKHSSGQENYIIFMDGDIIIQEKNNLSTLVESLNNKPHALISTDQPIKDIEFKNTKSIRYLLLAFSKLMKGPVST